MRHAHTSRRLATAALMSWSSCASPAQVGAAACLLWQVGAVGAAAAACLLWQIVAIGASRPYCCCCSLSTLVTAY